MYLVIEMILHLYYFYLPYCYSNPTYCYFYLPYCYSNPTYCYYLCVNWLICWFICVNAMI